MAAYELFIYANLYTVDRNVCIYVTPNLLEFIFNHKSKHICMVFFSGFVLLTFCDIMYHVKYEYL